ncbi:MAG: hypothetical protein C0489_05660 [Candidatus Accumulibacter sp.]|nr:hypothetical protein [Accumulibacter sp.]MBA4093557.1 hypothetical protein [Accumulibacter sp.]
MSITLIEAEADRRTCRLQFDGSMTFAHARELEDGIIDAMHRYQRLEIDLSGVREIDILGIHLLGQLQAFGDGARIVARSEVVQQACDRLLSSPRRSYLRNSGESVPAV